MLPQAVSDLLKSLEIVGVPERLGEPGQAINLGLNPPIDAFDDFGGEVSSAFNLDLEEVDFGGLNIEELRRLKLDLGTLKLVNEGKDELKTDLGSLRLADDAGVPGLQLDLGELIPNLKIDLGTIVPNDLQAASGPVDDSSATTDSHFVVKAVEFDAFQSTASDVDSDETAAGPLPYFVPDTSTSTILLGAGTKVQGYLGKLKSKVQNLLLTVSGSLQQDPAKPGKIDGSINQDKDLGRLKGSLKHLEKEDYGSIKGALEHVHSSDSLPGIVLPALEQKKNPETGVPENLGFIKATLKRSILQDKPKVDVTWHVTDGAGRELSDGVDYLVTPNNVPGDPPLNQPAPSILPLPKLVEFIGLTANPSSQIAISCEVTIAATLPDGTLVNPPPRTIGPRYVAVPQLQVPTVAALTEHAVTDKAFPGATLISVPGFSAIDDLGFLEEPLTVMKTAVENVRAFVRLTGLKVSVFAGVPKAIDLMIGLLNTLHFRKADIVELEQSVIERNLLEWPTKTFEDILSGLVLLGPPRREISCHVWRGLQHRGGEFHVILGELNPAAVIPDLRQPSKLDQPEEGLTDSAVSVAYPPTPDEGRPSGTFNDCLSSFRFFSAAGTLPPKPMDVAITYTLDGHQANDFAVEVRDARSGFALIDKLVILRNGQEGGAGFADTERKTDAQGKAFFGNIFFQSWAVRSWGGKPWEPEEIIDVYNPTLRVVAEGYSPFLRHFDGADPEL